MTAAPGSDAWRHELDATAAALVLAVLDRDEEAVNAVLGTCTSAEARQVAVRLAEGLVACCEPQDRAGLRGTVTALLRSGAFA